jgi:hypothetical protein
MKKCLIPQMVREMQIKALMSCHLTSVRMAIIQKTSVGEDIKEREPLQTVGEDIQ